MTLLNPGGLVLVDGTRQHCESEGILLAAGSPVEIVAVKGNRVVVRPVDESSDETPGRPRERLRGETPLDFDLPQS